MLYNLVCVEISRQSRFPSLILSINKTTPLNQCFHISIHLYFLQTVDSQYLGIKKPLGGFSYYINILGDTFQMNTVLREIRDAFTTRLSGAVDSVMFSHSDLISTAAGIVFESWYRFSHFTFLFCYVSHISNICFLHILLCTAERMSDRKAVRSQAKQMATNVLKLCEDAVMRR